MRMSLVGRLTTRRTSLATFACRRTAPSTARRPVRLRALGKAYDLAAPADQPGAALEWLELALTRPGSERICGPWLGRDPDLARLHGNDRFDRLPIAIRRTE